MKQLLRRIFRRRSERKQQADEAMRTMESAWHYLWFQYWQLGVVKEAGYLFPDQLQALNILNDASRVVLYAAVDAA